MWLIWMRFYDQHQTISSQYLDMYLKLLIIFLSFNLYFSEYNHSIWLAFGGLILSYQKFNSIDCCTTLSIFGSVTSLDEQRITIMCALMKLDQTYCKMTSWICRCSFPCFILACFVIPVTFTANLESRSWCYSKSLLTYQATQVCKNELWFWWVCHKYHTYLLS